MIPSTSLVIVSFTQCSDKRSCSRTKELILAPHCLDPFTAELIQRTQSRPGKFLQNLALFSSKVRSNCCSVVLAPRSMGWLCRVSVYRQTSLELDVQCTASDCARLLLMRGSPHAQMPEWQTSIPLAFNTLVLQCQAASTQRRRLPSSVPASSQSPLCCAARPRKSSTSGEVI